MKMFIGFGRYPRKYFTLSTALHKPRNSMSLTVHEIPMSLIKCLIPCMLYFLTMLLVKGVEILIFFIILCYKKKYLKVFVYRLPVDELQLKV